MRELSEALGITIDTGTGSDAEIDARLEDRDAARARGDFATADRIRTELAGQGIVLEDTPGGTVWHRR